jgi:hypothetical protein
MVTMTNTTKAGGRTVPLFLAKFRHARRAYAREDDRAVYTVCSELFRPKLPNEPQPPADPPGLVRILQRQKGGDTRDESLTVLLNGLAVGRKV